MSATLFKDRHRFIGSVYPGADPQQDLGYAAKVTASQRPTEAAALEPVVSPPLSKSTARGRNRK